jgi:hypothetical protein
MIPGPGHACSPFEMIEGSIHMVLCYVPLAVDDSAATHINPKVLEGSDFYAYCSTPAGGGFRFERTT